MRSGPWSTDPAVPRSKLTRLPGLVAGQAYLTDPRVMLGTTAPAASMAFAAIDPMPGKVMISVSLDDLDELLN